VLAQPRDIEDRSDGRARGTHPDIASSAPSTFHGLHDDAEAIAVDVGDARKVDQELGSRVAEKLVELRPELGCTRDIDGALQDKQDGSPVSIDLGVHIPIVGTRGFAGDPFGRTLARRRTGNRDRRPPDREARVSVRMARSGSDAGGRSPIEMGIPPLREWHAVCTTSWEAMKSVVVSVVWAVMALGLPTAGAQTVKYVDTQGVTHYVGSVDQVPERYRARATTPPVNARSNGTGGPDLAEGSDQAGETHENPADDP
jgi:hypothetical protein